jgi:hypothetical protein
LFEVQHPAIYEAVAEGPTTGFGGGKFPGEEKTNMDARLREKQPKSNVRRWICFALNAVPKTPKELSFAPSVALSLLL